MASWLKEFTLAYSMTLSSTTALLTGPVAGALWRSSIRCHPRGRTQRLHSAFSVRASQLPSQGISTSQERKNDADLLACPICFQHLRYEIKTKYVNFKCTRCRKAYSNEKGYIDLTITGGTGNVYEEVTQPSTEMFRNPALSYVYERGYRQAFTFIGYPGPDEEFKLANKYLEHASGGVLIDVSCASGVSTRRFIKSGIYSSVIGVDFSESMLKEFQGFVQQDPQLNRLNVTLLRADVARLPFGTGTIDGVHAGAAMHCWPSALNGVAEISRILKPGGIFVATTNAFDVIPSIRQAARRLYGGPITWTEAELEDICRTCGLVNWTRIRRAGFIMFFVQKPS